MGAADVSVSLPWISSRGEGTPNPELKNKKEVGIGGLLTRDKLKNEVQTD